MQHMATLPVYALVYGGEWEDIMYFSDLEKAKTKLVVQSVGKDPYEMHPILYEYNDNNGVYARCKRYWMLDLGVLKVPTLLQDLKTNPGTGWI